MNTGAARLGAISGSLSGGPSPTRTLAARMEDAVRGIDYNADRIQCVLNKINGAPNAGVAETSERGPTQAMSLSVEQAEALGKRLNELASALELVA